MKIAVLALQGAFAEHRKILEECGAETFEIRQKKDILQSFDGIVLPGGESTVMGKLLRELNIMDDIRGMIKNGMPVFGTCAGLILLADKISGSDESHIATMSITARRNAYGRQLGSFNANAEFKGIGEIPLTFIRAPYIEEVRGDAEILCTVDEKIVASRQGNQLAVAFHPELTDDKRVHEYFLNMI